MPPIIRLGSLERDQDWTNVGVRRYSPQQLYVLRRGCLAPAVLIHREVLAALSALNVLKFRGSRGGRRRNRPIDVLMPSRRQRLRMRVADAAVDRRCLVPVVMEPAHRCTGSPALRKDEVPCFYIINARSIAKPHALDQLHAELTGYGLGLAIVSEKKHHLSTVCRVDGFRMFRRDRQGRRAGGVAVLVSDTLTAVEYEVDLDLRTLELLWVKVVLPTRNAYVGALYHPPSPVYDVNVLLNRLEHSVESIMMSDPHALIIIGGDFNQLREDEVVERTGLTPIMTQPTRGENTLDRLFVSEPCFDSVKILTSAIKTDHRAIIATSSGKIITTNKRKEWITFRKRTPQQNATLLHGLATVDLSMITATRDPQEAWDHFYLEARETLDRIYPLRSVTMTSADPLFLTPEAKLLLRRENRLMRAGLVEKASALAIRVGVLIEKTTRAHLRNIDLSGGLRELWSQVSKMTKGGVPEQTFNPLTAENLNEHYAKTSTDLSYQPPALKQTAASDRPFTSEYKIFHILDRLHHTADGADGLPAWFLRLAAPVYSSVLSELINRLFAESHVPTQWSTAIIHPVAKVQSPTQPADFRPISITPVLSRAVERALVHEHLYPTFTTPFMSHLLDDQFEFRPTGSTTAALIAILHQITVMLRTNSYVTLISLDFSKAFDTVRHYTFAEKLSGLDIHDNVYNWLINFLKDWKHVTRFKGRTSSSADINASFVQGSGVGPSSYDINASDLQPVHSANRLIKYADDTYLLVGSEMRVTVHEELQHVADWAEHNNLRLNASKSREMLVKRRGCVELPPPLEGVERVESMKILGVTLRQDLKAASHVDEIIGACSGSLHALRTLGAHGLPPKAVHIVAEATTVARLLYAAPAWWGFASTADHQRLERFLARIKRVGYLPAGSLTMEERVGAAEDRLLQAVVWNEEQVLRHLFPPTVHRRYSLSPRAHEFELPRKDDKNFISRILYKRISL